MAKLTEPWFEARFLRTNADGGHHFLDDLDGADGLFLWCPCGYNKLEFPLDGPRPHGIIVSFKNPINAAEAPLNGGSQSRDGSPSRWIVEGTGLTDLTLRPSIDVGAPSCWHGFITSGEVA